MSHDHPSPSPLDHVALFRIAAEQFAVAVAKGPLDAPVAACPGWDLRALAGHLGGVHRWAHQAILTGASPGPYGPAPDVDGDALAGWIREGAAAIAATFDDLDDDTPTWHPFPVAKVAGLWPRRQHHETTVHRWDAEAAIGEPGPIAPEVASDGIDEYFEVMLPRLVSRAHLTVPGSTLHVHCTDVAGEWLVWAEDGGIGMRREHAKGDAALRGPAEALLLRLWGRAVPEGSVDIVGDPDAAAAWLELGGV